MIKAKKNDIIKLSRLATTMSKTSGDTNTLQGPRAPGNAGNSTDAGNESKDRHH